MTLDNQLLVAEEISNKEYLALVNPIFLGQTPLDDNLMYWILWSDCNFLYKTHNELFVEA
jgi:hypothetical protein